MRRLYECSESQHLKDYDRAHDNLVRGLQPPKLKGRKNSSRAFRPGNRVGDRGHGSEISRANYDFVFLRQEDFGVVAEYVLRIVPKRKDRYLLRGQIWVDASTFHIRRIERIPAKSPSFWIKDIHIPLQYAELNGMGIPISFDAIATVRFLGQYSLAGLNIRARDQLSAALKHEP